MRSRALNFAESRKIPMLEVSIGQSTIFECREAKFMRSFGQVGVSMSLLNVTFEDFMAEVFPC